MEEARCSPSTLKAAHVYATFRSSAASYDRLIAAHALSHGLTLVTDNETDFDDVPNLKVENWAKA